MMLMLIANGEQKLCFVQGCLTPRPTGLSITDTDFRRSTMPMVTLLFVSLRYDIIVIYTHFEYLSKCNYEWL